MNYDINHTIIDLLDQSMYEFVDTWYTSNFKSIDQLCIFLITNTNEWIMTSLIN